MNRIVLAVSDKVSTTAGRLTHGLLTINLQSSDWCVDDRLKWPFLPVLLGLGLTVSRRSLEMLAIRDCCMNEWFLRGLFSPLVRYRRRQKTLHLSVFAKIAHGIQDVL